MAIAGLRGTGDWGTDERPKNFREMILWRNPNGQAPLTAIMAKANSGSGIRLVGRRTERGEVADQLHHGLCDFGHDADRRYRQRGRPCGR
jgi:hypothetical protein